MGGRPTGATNVERQRGIEYNSAAGNSGSGPNTVLAPASGYNVISVAALGTDVTNPHPGCHPVTD